MSTATYYCHDCEARRLVDWTNMASCTECGSTLLDQIPFVDEEEEDVFSETESFFFYQTNIEEDEEEEDEEERCLFEYLSSIYQQTHMEHEEKDRREFLNHLMDMMTNSEDIIRSLNKVRLEISDPGVNEECSICQEIFGNLLDVTVLPYIDNLFAQDIPTSLEDSMVTPYSSMNWRQQTQESQRTEDE
ncbi:uncharacterized protein B0P05DRAFT_585293 [Gilbertella persicaria]|uniref:uncharacterized protein n=1 Tax=Gilbertella persicaria TaxID=101096 RepID=UPI00221EDDDF|nr:uncharacterized protein B0P05DRAFT_585293 [Gilbertella persicaria]KAI8085760.1 hypothetical protein B0P05DRAFT_585293 [Gilbertella persicaria]